MNIFRRFHRKSPRDHFLSFSPLESRFQAVTWNFDLQEPGTRQWMIETHGEYKLRIDWVKNSTETLRFFKDGRIQRKCRVSSMQTNELKSLMNLALHSTLKHGLEIHQAFMLGAVSGVTTLDMQNELKSLQWLQASFGTLKRALEKMSQDPSMILSAAFFSGEEPETGDRVLRLLAFNLDIFFYMKEEGALAIAVFDDKGSPHGSTMTPVFNQTIKVTKPQFYDEIVSLVHQLAEVGEVK